MDNRYYFSGLDKDSVNITGQEFQHLTRVRRAKVGDEIVGFNGDGYDYFLKIYLQSVNIQNFEYLPNALARSFYYIKYRNI